MRRSCQFCKGTSFVHRAECRPCCGVHYPGYLNARSVRHDYHIAHGGLSDSSQSTLPPSTLFPLLLPPTSPDGGTRGTHARPCLARTSVPLASVWKTLEFAPSFPRAKQSSRRPLSPEPYKTCPAVVDAQISSAASDRKSVLLLTRYYCHCMKKILTCRRRKKLMFHVGRIIVHRGCCIPKFARYM